MITSDVDPRSRETTIILQPNHSWTWRANVWLVASLMVVSCTAGLVLTALGYWLVLFFTLLELGLLSWCLHYCVSRTHRQEVLRLNQERLILESGIRRPTKTIEIERFFARFFVRPPTYRGHHSSLALRYADNELEIGSFLTDDEREQLISLLRSTIHRLDNPHAFN